MCEGCIREKCDDMCSVYNSLIGDYEENYREEYEESMKRELDPCDICEYNQIDICSYIENDDRKSCNILKDYLKEEVIQSTTADH